MKTFCLSLLCAIAFCLSAAAAPARPAPVTYELACPAGSSPASEYGKTFNAKTGLWRANVCISDLGDGYVFCNMQGCGPTVFPPNWSAVTPGTNTGALLMGGAGSLAPTGIGQIASNQLWLANLLPGPPTPTVTTSAPAAGGSFNQGHSALVQIVFNTASGTTFPSQPSAGTNCAVGGACTVRVTAPTLPPGYTGYTVYDCDTANGTTCNAGSIKRQNASAACVNITVDCVISTAGAGAAVPTVNTAWLQPSNFSNTCPAGILPLGSIQKTDGNNYSLYGIDALTRGPLASPFGIMEFCQPLWVNDTGTIANIFKNNMVSFYHQFEAPYLGVGAGVDDRALGIRAETLTTITGSNHGRFMGVYGEIGIRGAPTAFNASPDTGAIGLRWTVDDSRTGGTLGGSPMVALDGSYQDTTSGGATTGSCGFQCGVGVRGIAQSDAGANGAGTYTGGYFGTSANGSAGIGYSLVAGAATGARFTGANYQFLVENCSFCNSTLDWAIYHAGSGSTTPGVGANLPSVIAGASELGDIYAANAGTINAYASIENVQTLATAQIATPTFNNGNVIAVGATGATSYTYKIVFRDASGGATAVSAAGTVANGNATLSSSNYNIILFNIPSPAPASIDVYRTASGGTPSSTGKLANVPIANFGQALATSGPGRTSSQQYLLFDKALAGDSTTPPTINTTGAISSGSNLKSTAVTFSNLAACVSGLEGTMQAVTDSTTATWGATITGSSTNHVLAYCDGTNWTVAAK